MSFGCGVVAGSSQQEHAWILVLSLLAVVRKNEEILYPEDD